MLQIFSRFIPFFLLVRRRFSEDRCVQFAASLTYTTLLALVPIVVIALAILSAFPMFTDLMTQLKVFILLNFVPTSAGKIISVYMQQFTSRASNLTVMGIGLLTLTAFVLMLTIDHAFNVIWRVRRKRPLLRRLLIYSAVLTLGPLMIGASLSMTSYLVSFSLGLVGGAPVISIFGLKVFPLALTIVAFTLLYMMVPNRLVLQRHALAGGMVAGLAFELMKKLFTLYITHFPTYKLVYGAFAGVPLFLIWIYLSWLVILFGAVIVAALPYWSVSVRQVGSVAGREFFIALEMLRALFSAQQEGKILGLMQVLKASEAGPEDSEDILDRLHEAGWAGVDDQENWALTRNAVNLRLADVYRVFVFDPDRAYVVRGIEKTRQDQLLKSMMASQNDALSLLVKDFFRPG